MSERLRLFFFSNTLGGLPNLNTRSAFAVEATAPTIQINEYEKLVAALSADEKAQLERIRPVLQKLIIQVRQKFKSPDFKEVLIGQDRFEFSLPEKPTPAVFAICTQVLNYEHKRAIDEHNAGVPASTPRDDLYKLN
jgi:hypothetical protein